jgi:beta-lactamase regulating signal transducer with metallopeptidase domain
MLTWMLYAMAIAATMCLAAMSVERVAARVAAATRILWAVMLCVSLGWAIVVATRGSSGGDAASAATIAAPSSGQAPTAGYSSIGPASDSSLGGVGTNGLGLDLLLLAVWIASSFVCLSVLAVSKWRISRMRPRWREGLVAGVPVMFSHDVGPAVVGLVHHCIVVPTWIETLDGRQQQIVLAHEREHVRAGDPLLLWSATLLVSLMPWNLPLWFGLRRLRHAIELDCDARVLRGRSNAQEYCELLLDVGERTLAGVAPIAALAEPATLLERRIDAMLATNALGWRSAVGAALSAAMLAVACYAPKPELTPRARVSAAVSELTSLLATDHGREIITPAERARLEYVLKADEVASMHAADSASAESANSFGARTDSIARLRYPEAFRPHDDAYVAGAIYSKDGKLIKSFVKRMPLNVAFDVSRFQKKARDSQVLVELATDEALVQPLQTGSQTLADAPNTVIVFAVLMN